MKFIFVKSPEDTDQVNAIFRTSPAGDLRGSCGRPAARGHHVDDP